MAVANVASVAAKFGMNFGGELHEENNPHGVDSRSLLEGFFGSDVAQLAAPPFAASFPDLYSLARAAEAKEMYAGEAYFLDTGEYWAAVDAYLAGKGVTLNYFFTPIFLQAFRGGSTFLKMPAPLFNPDRLSVAIHVRRGDSSGDFIRASSNEFYFAFVDALRSLVADADIHIWSSNEGFLPPTYFDEYQRRGMTVHVDTDVSEALAHFAQADVLVQAKSAFSHVPAFLNDNCVIQLRFWHHALEEWTLIDDMEPVRAGPIQECLKRVKRSSHAPS